MILQGVLLFLVVYQTNAACETTNVLQCGTTTHGGCEDAITECDTDTACLTPLYCTDDSACRTYYDDVLVCYEKWDCDTDPTYGGIYDTIVDSITTLEQTYCTATDPCDGVVCDSPPNECWDSSGTCGAGQCVYIPLSAATYCSGGVCDGSGTCQIDDPCEGVVCASPPNNECWDSSSGTCGAGECVYTPLSAATDCSGGVCDGSGACVLDGPCAGGDETSCTLNSATGICHNGICEESTCLNAFPAGCSSSTLYTLGDVPCALGSTLTCEESDCCTLKDTFELTDSDYTCDTYPNEHVTSVATSADCEALADLAGVEFTLAGSDINGCALDTIGNFYWSDSGTDTASCMWHTCLCMYDFDSCTLGCGGDTHATCGSEGADARTCICDEGYVGSMENLADDELFSGCSIAPCSSPCVHDGICNQPISDECICPDGYEGSDCSLVSDCSLPCLNGGTCNQPNLDSCHCPSGLTGVDCGTEYELRVGTSGGYECLCDDGEVLRGSNTICAQPVTTAEDCEDLAIANGHHFHGEAGADIQGCMRYVSSGTEEQVAWSFSDYSGSAVCSGMSELAPEADYSQVCTDPAAYDSSLTVTFFYQTTREIQCGVLIESYYYQNGGSLDCDSQAADMNNMFNWAVDELAIDLDQCCTSGHSICYIDELSDELSGAQTVSMFLPFMITTAMLCGLFQSGQL